MTKAKIKAPSCPICGKRPIPNGGPGAHGLKCQSSTHFFQSYGSTKGEAAIAFNSRSPAITRLSARVTKLEGALKRLGGVEAFIGSRPIDPTQDAELVARMRFADQSLVYEGS